MLPRSEACAGIQLNQHFSFLRIDGLPTRFNQHFSNPKTMEKGFPCIHPILVFRLGNRNLSCTDIRILCHLL